MIDRKKIREAVGLTHEALKSSPEAWFSIASSFHFAAKLLDEFAGQIPSDSRPFALNAALSLELVFKAILAKRNQPVPDGPNGHDLVALCELAGLVVSMDQQLTLELMAQELIWLARYPTPKRAEKFDQLHDEILEKHIIRDQVGNVYSARANPKTFPGFENYERIWVVAIEAFQGP